MGDTPPTVVYAGTLAQQPRNGGLTWFHLQFLLGLRRLGWHALFLDRLSPEMCVDAAGRPAAFDDSLNLRYFLRVMADFGLAGSFSLDYNRGEQVVGVPRGRVLELAERAGLLLNVMGYLDDEAVLARAPRRVFVDIDPGFPQMWRDLGLHDAFRGHTDFVTLGRNVGRPGCPIPTCGLRWLTMPQPVVLDHWPARPPAPGGAFTTIGAWRGPNGPVEYRGRTYGLRVHEFRKFVGLPARCPGERFELALDIHPGDAADLRRLAENGWAVVDPKAVAGGPAEYRDYVARSKAEFMVPKQMYVAAASGLLSDRSAYYLATGRPVLARDTGLAGLYPTGDGLLTFTTPDEAAAGVEAINRDYDRHCQAARAIAEEYFDSHKVLARLLADLGVA
ncbi:MAG TPA: hypothetical protein VGF55_30635 [Gemmataceae bacterium]|jgi:hypothetical protein